MPREAEARPPAQRLLAAMLALIAAIAWAGSWQGAFQYDDFQVIVDNPVVHSWSSLSAVFGHGLRPVLKLCSWFSWVSGGGSPLAFRLWLKPAALLERQLTIADVSRALEAQNVLAALGQTGDAPGPPGQATTLPLRMEGRLRSPEELEQLVVGRGPEGGVVLLRDSSVLSISKNAMFIFQ